MKEVGRHRTASTSTSTPLPWITVHNVTKDKIDSTPVSLKNQQAEGKHSSFVSDDINVILDDIPQPAAAAPVISAPLAFASGDNKWQGGWQLIGRGGVWQCVYSMHTHFSCPECMNTVERDARYT